MTTQETNADPLARDWTGRPPDSCDFCGRLMYGEPVDAQIAESTRRFCGADCRDLYRGYWIPRHGAERVARIEVGA